MNNVDTYRKLTGPEITKLIQTRNKAENWDKILVADPFYPEKIENCFFSGTVKIDSFSNKKLNRDEITLGTGIYNSIINNTVIGNNCAIHNVGFLSNYTVEEEVMLFNVDELITSRNKPVFGTGLQTVNGNRNWLNVANENGGRRVLPFGSMLTADCCLWSKYRDNSELMKKLISMTDKEELSNPKGQGIIGKGSTIRSTRLIKNIITGEGTVITGADILENLTINSSFEAPAFIGEGVELINGIIGKGASVRLGAKAVNFVLSSYSNLKSGVRFFDSFLGENSTVACCEVQSSLIFPFHEQHHNNSFLIASTIQGQSNIAAGATIGSNHNSRGADGEILAERGFWPALSSSLKHNCKFASFVLLSKGDYPYELDIKLPFSLVSNDESNNRLVIMPGYWFMYNMYALARNSWKFKNRDKRKDKSLVMEFDYLAPDTIEEMFKSLELLKLWTGRAWFRRYKSFTDHVTKKQTMEKGEEILSSPSGEISSLEVIGEDMENSTRNVIVIKADKAYDTYRRMIHYYGIRNIVYYAERENVSLYETIDRLKNSSRSSWINLGGQLLDRGDVESLKSEILTSNIKTWDQVHKKYYQLGKDYFHKKAAHAFASVLSLYNLYPFEENKEKLTIDFWKKALLESVEIQKSIEKNTLESRIKDYTNNYRKITFDSQAEMEAVLGTAHDNNFINIIHSETVLFEKYVNNLL